MILDVVLFHVRADVFFHLLVFTDLELQGALQYNTRLSCHEEIARRYFIPGSKLTFSTNLFHHSLL